jgi:DNA repair protein RecO (recombination protein O)
MEWEAPGILLHADPFGEGDALVSVLTEAQGRHRGLARGGASRRQAALWQPGNLLHLRWLGRLADQLGSFSGELIHAGAAPVLDEPLLLAMLSAACAVAEGALPERAPHPLVFAGLLRLIAALPRGAAMLAAQVRWEAALLAELGYGLDLSCCALSGARAGLTFVSPRSGRAVSEAAAGIWRGRLLPLPGFLLDEEAPAGLADWRDGLRLTGHFLARDAFGQQHRPLPLARLSLYDRVAESTKE